MGAASSDGDYRLDKEKDRYDVREHDTHCTDAVHDKQTRKDNTERHHTDAMELTDDRREGYDKSHRDHGGPIGVVVAAPQPQAGGRRGADTGPVHHNREEASRPASRRGTKPATTPDSHGIRGGATKAARRNHHVHNHRDHDHHREAANADSGAPMRRRGRWSSSSTPSASLATTPALHDPSTATSPSATPIPTPTGADEACEEETSRDETNEPVRRVCTHVASPPPHPSPRRGPIGKDGCGGGEEEEDHKSACGDASGARHPPRDTSLPASSRRALYHRPRSRRDGRANRLCCSGVGGGRAAGVAVCDRSRSASLVTLSRKESIAHQNDSDEKEEEVEEEAASCRVDGPTSRRRGRPTAAVAETAALSEARATRRVGRTDADAVGTPVRNDGADALWHTREDDRTPTPSPTPPTPPPLASWDYSPSRQTTPFSPTRRRASRNDVDGTHRATHSTPSTRTAALTRTPAAASDDTPTQTPAQSSSMATSHATSTGRWIGVRPAIPSPPPPPPPPGNACVSRHTAPAASSLAASPPPERTADPPRLPPRAVTWSVAFTDRIATPPHRRRGRPHAARLTRGLPHHGLAPYRSATPDDTRHTDHTRPLRRAADLTERATPCRADSSTDTASRRIGVWWWCGEEEEEDNITPADARGRRRHTGRDAPPPRDEVAAAAAGHSTCRGAETRAGGRFNVGQGWIGGVDGAVREEKQTRRSGRGALRAGLTRRVLYQTRPVRRRRLAGADEAELPPPPPEAVSRACVDGSEREAPSEKAESARVAAAPHARVRQEVHVRHSPSKSSSRPDGTPWRRRDNRRSGWSFLAFHHGAVPRIRHASRPRAGGVDRWSEEKEEEEGQNDEEEEENDEEKEEESEEEEEGKDDGHSVRWIRHTALPDAHSSASTTPSLVSARQWWASAASSSPVRRGTGAPAFSAARHGTNHAVHVASDSTTGRTPPMPETFPQAEWPPMTRRVSPGALDRHAEVGRRWTVPPGGGSTPPTGRATSNSASHAGATGANHPCARDANMPRSGADTHYTRGSIPDNQANPSPPPSPSSSRRRRRRNEASNDGDDSAVAVVVGARGALPRRWGGVPRVMLPRRVTTGMRGGRATTARFDFGAAGLLTQRRQPHYAQATVSFLIGAEWRYQRMYVDRYLCPNRTANDDPQGGREDESEGEKDE